MDINLEQFKNQCFNDTVENLEFLLGRFKHDVEYLKSVNQQFKNHWNNEIEFIEEKINIISSVINVRKSQFESVKVIVPKQTFKYVLLVTDVVTNISQYYSYNKLHQSVNDECDYFAFSHDAEEYVNIVQKKYPNCLISIVKVTTQQELIKSCI